MRVAAFITSHGFGHAGRACAVLNALHARRPTLAAEVFTAVPDGFLRTSLAMPYQRILKLTDVGMIQRGPFHADLESTAQAVTAFLDGLERAAEAAAARLGEARCGAVLSDISPLGILAAVHAGIPAVLIENFRWDWIYTSLEDAPQELRATGERLAEIYHRADLHLQAPPVCEATAGAIQLTLPVARAARSSRAEARRALGAEGEAPLVLVTTGGVSGEQSFVDALGRRPDLLFLVTGADRSGRVGNVIHFEMVEPLYLPDLIRASDAVVAKLGYSTLAEVWREGRPLLRVPRAQWPEGAVLSAWAAEHLPGIEVDEATFQTGDWVARLDELLALPLRPAHLRAGQDEAAERILPLLG